MNKFFCESDGTPSSMRLIMFIGSIYAMVMGAWVFADTDSWQALIATVPALAGVFVGGKIIQKTMENTPPS